MSTQIHNHQTNIQFEYQQYTKPLFDSLDTSPRTVLPLFISSNHVALMQLSTQKQRLKFYPSCICKENRYSLRRWWKPITVSRIRIVLAVIFQLTG